MCSFFTRIWWENEVGTPPSNRPDHGVLALAAAGYLRKPSIVCHVQGRYVGKCCRIKVILKEQNHPNPLQGFE